MAHGKSKGSVTGVYTKRVEDLMKKAERMSQAFRYINDFRPWHTPEELLDKDMLLVPGMHNPAWSRNEPNTIYCENVMGGANSDGGNAGDTIAMKLQIDFLAVEERAWRMRHMSLIRGACLAHGRMHGHSNAPQGVFKRAERVVKDYIKAGKAMEAR
jgi:hypothetical protein